MNDAINHPEAAQLVDSLVTSEGGLVSYELGAPGRLIAIAAGAHLAVRTGTPLTVIDLRPLLPQYRHTVAELYPDLTYTPMTAGEAVQHPEHDTGGVLVVHTDVLHHNPSTREALLARVGAAGRLIVASRTDVDESVLNALRSPHSRLVVSVRNPPVPNDASPEIRRRFEGMGFENFAETFAEVVQHTDPAELRQRIARVQELQGQRAADYPAPTAPQQVTCDHGQEQSAAHQQQGSWGIGLT
ncbi:hypothetical protein [Streptomyces noursei]|uniref:hypothetical protein n=1 Tax=Streptomyces noursei TaxID=1971 RepID=UPI003813A102